MAEDRDDYTVDDSIGFRDLLFNLLLTFLFIIFILLMVVVDNKKAVDDPSRYLITVEWNHDVDLDIDTYVRLDKNLVHYNNKKIGPLVLDRDDRGAETIILNGQESSVDLNREVVSIRSVIPDGVLLQVNVHAFDWPDWMVKVPKLEVKVEVIALNPYRVIDTQTRVMTFHNEEQVIGIYRADNGELSLLGREGQRLAPISQWGEEP